MNCTTCMIGDFKSELCKTEFCEKCGKEGSSEDVENILTNYVAKEALRKNEMHKLSNREWKEFLAEQFGISKTSAKEMLHGMMVWKKEDNFKRIFNPMNNDHGERKE